jgi:protein-S-isoprenylcysteine O-methyltransferase Ste14
MGAQTRWLAKLSRASAFEFRHRFLIISACYLVGFGCYGLDRTNAAVAALRLAFGEVTRGRVQATLALATAVVALAAALRTWASAYLPSVVVHDTVLHRHRLVADGPYRFVRNPLYLGNLLMAWGMGLLASRLGFALIVVVQTLFYRRLIGREEAALAASGGEGYAAFCAAVPRLWPSAKPRLPASGARPLWAQAFAGEAFFWLLGVAQAGFAWTLDMRVFGLLAAVAFAVYYLVVAIQRGARPRAGVP